MATASQPVPGRSPLNCRSRLLGFTQTPSLTSGRPLSSSVAAYRHSQVMTTQLAPASATEAVHRPDKFLGGEAAEVCP